MAEYVNTRGETTLKELVDLHQNSVREYISQFDKVNDAKRDLQRKFITVFRKKKILTERES
ncbi:hypothetical protein BDF21DRAFT_426845 [Thamnidium elegans]|nr:hypothetical protein BDF21DRAFT_426843 [Thamnidium elegans]KAI8065997.1 hypothetical protein BDF21DRAFT_426845 [Thamnidium elegans]